MKRPSIHFYFDVVSPYSFLAFCQLRRYIQLGQWRQHVDIEFIPIYLGGVMQMTENRPPATIPAKGKWMFHDLQLYSKVRGIPLQVPPKCGFPLNTLKTMRFLTALKAAETREVYESTIHRLFSAYWSESLNVSLLETLETVLAPGILSKENIGSYWALIENTTTKEELMANTKRAVEEFGAFGAPWIVVSKSEQERHCFWGNDRFDLIIYYLNQSELSYETYVPRSVCSL